MIDTQTPQSVGWWMSQMAARLTHPRRLQRLNLLESHYRGEPPLPMGAERHRDAYRAFQRKARSNFSALIVDAPVSMLQVRAIRTAVANDDYGDALAMRYFRRNQLQQRLRDAWTWRGVFGESYLSVGMPETSAFAAGEDPVPVICQEHPRQTITLDDPMTGRARVAFKLFRDDVQGLDFAYLWLRQPDHGELHVAVKQTGSQVLPINPMLPTFDSSFTLAPEYGAEWDQPVVPVVKLRNRDCRGEFEPVLDILDRINHMLLQRMVIATFQAFRQRAIHVDPKDMPDKDPDTGEEIDYDDILAADAGSLWKLPLTSKMWESQSTDLTPILSSVKDDVLHLAAITRTPLTMFTPDAATQTAEGAQLQREGQVFKVMDLQRASDVELAEVFSLAFMAAGHPERADLDSISVEFRPAERYSLAERAAAAVQADQAQVPWRTRLSEIWQFSPEQIDRMETEREDDALFAAAHATVPAGAPPARLPSAARADSAASGFDHRHEAVG